MENMGYSLSTIEKIEPVYNEKEQIIRENFPFFGGISFLYGIIYLFCMYKNYFGLTFLIYTIATVIVLKKFLNKIEQKITKETKIYFSAIILSGLSTCITANGFIQFMNWCFLIVLLFLSMFSQFYPLKKWNTGTYLKNMVKLFFTTVRYSLLSLSHANNYAKRAEMKKNKNIKGIIGGIISASAVLVFILPLLFSSDIIFEQIFIDAFIVFDFNEVVEGIANTIGISFTFFIGFTSIYALFYASCHLCLEEMPERKMGYCNLVTGITFTGIMATVYGIYSFIQIRYLFLGNGLPEGITYSAYAHQGFWQLLFVAFINICMVMICGYIFEKNKILDGIMTIISGCTFVMIASAFYRMMLYIGAYHLTMLRVLVLWALVILALIMTGIVISIYKDKFPFMKYVIMVVICGYLVLSFAQPDYWIAKYNISKMEEVTSENLYYMLYRLSYDAAPAIMEIEDKELLFYDDNCWWYYQDILEDTDEINIRNITYSTYRARKIAEEYFEEFSHYKKP